MVKDLWDSFKDNIKERVSNPFLGTFALVWIVHNWRIVYAFFYFDKEWKLESKIEYFQKYWIDNSFIWNLISVAVFTLFVLIVTYIFLALSRFLSNYFENVIIPLISKLSKGKVYTQEQYKKLAEKVENLESKIELERKAKNDAIIERDEFEKRIYQQVENISLEENKKINKKINQENFSNIISQFKKLFSKEEIDQTLVALSKELSYIENEDIVDFLLKYGFVKLKEKNAFNNSIVYMYTTKGESFKIQYFNSLSPD